MTSPVEMRKAKNILAPGGFVYTELPDGTMAIKDSLQREEFYIEHLHVFSMASVYACGKSWVYGQGASKGD